MVILKDIDIDMYFLENIDIDSDKEMLKNIDKAILQNIDIDKIFIDSNLSYQTALVPVFSW